jgi:hypothetical protein
MENLTSAERGAEDLFKDGNSDSAVDDTHTEKEIHDAF